MNIQNGTLDTRLPQNIIRNFEIPTNVEHGALNPFKIGGGNAIWATYFPPNVKVWFSTTPNFDSAQRLDYMNRGMRFNAIGSDGIQQQYDNFYIFTKGTWNDVVKIAVSSQGDMVQPILSSNTGDIDSVGRVASILKMPVNGASGYNEPDFESELKNKYCVGVVGDRTALLYTMIFPFQFTKFYDNKNYLIEIIRVSNTTTTTFGMSECYRSAIHLGVINNSDSELLNNLSGQTNCNNIIFKIKNTDNLKSNELFNKIMIHEIGADAKIHNALTGSLNYNVRGVDMMPKHAILSGKILNSGSLGLVIENFSDGNIYFQFTFLLKIYII